MKVVGITILRTGASLPDPIPMSMACDLSSYGFFQRQVREDDVLLVVSEVVRERRFACALSIG